MGGSGGMSSSLIRYAEPQAVMICATYWGSDTKSSYVLGTVTNSGPNLFVCCLFLR